MSNVVQHVRLSNVLGYSGIQRIGFSGIIIGFILCTIGCFPPYWKTGSISEDSIISFKVLDIRAGLWLFCVKVIGIEEECASTFHVFETLHDITSALHIENTSLEWLWVMCGASSMCLLLSLLCGLTACCRFCCCSGGKTICHGITAFLAGAFGVVTIIVFCLKVEDVYGLPFVDLDYGWAFFLFIAGSGILVISSFMLCFSSPRENPYQLMTTPNLPLVVAQTNTSTQMNATSYPPVPGQSMHRERELRPSNIGYGQDSTEFNRY